MYLPGHLKPDTDNEETQDLSPQKYLSLSFDDWYVRFLATIADLSQKLLEYFQELQPTEPRGNC